MTLIKHCLIYKAVNIRYFLWFPEAFLGITCGVPQVISDLYKLRECAYCSSISNVISLQNSHCPPLSGNYTDLYSVQGYRSF